jgi:hypothetical protein
MFNFFIVLVVDLRECGKWAVLPLHYRLEFTLRLKKTRKIAQEWLNRVGH